MIFFSKLYCSDGYTIWEYPTGLIALLLMNAVGEQLLFVLWKESTDLNF